MYKAKLIISNVKLALSLDFWCLHSRILKAKIHGKIYGKHWEHIRSNQYYFKVESYPLKNPKEALVKSIWSQ